ncbi:MAG: hypothetical protein IPM29_26515 [Planctomycetes bacterium]|nr:hypothetical protein [Planctomycetota bacterium]
MLRLLAADLRALVNVVGRREGRRSATATLVSLGFLLAVSWLFGQVLAMTPEVAELRHGLDADRARAAAGTLLMPALVMTLWFSFGGGARQLFEAPTLGLWWTAPLSSRAITLALWLRFATIVAVWCTALTTPALSSLGGALGLRFGLPALAAAALCLTLPTVAFVFAVQILVQRYLFGRRARLVMAGITTVGSLAFSAILIVGGLAQRDAAMAVVFAIRGRAVFPWLIEAPARLLAEDALGGVSATTALLAAATPLLAAVVLALLGPLHRLAWEIAGEAPESLGRRRRNRPWPTSAQAAVFRKELAQLLHQPGQLLGILFSTLIVVVLGASRFVGDHLDDARELPNGMRPVFMMLGLWLFAQLTVAPGCMVRLVVVDGRQWPLYMSAPVRTGALLLGKLRAAALLQAWPALVAVLIGATELGAGPAQIGLFLWIVPAGIAWTTALTGFVGTIPPLMRPAEDRNHLAVLLGVAILLLSLQLTALPGIWAWRALADWQAGEGPFATLSLASATTVVVAVLWGVLLLLSALAFGVARLQLARLRAPER